MHWPKQLNSFRLQLFLAFVAGIVTWVPSDNLIVFIRPFVAIFIYATLIKDKPLRKIVWLSAAFATGWFGLGLLWLHEIHIIGYLIMVAMQVTLFCFVIWLFGRNQSLTPFWLAMAFAFHELVRTVFPFGGFPMGSISLTQMSSTDWTPVQAASLSVVGGPLLVTFAIAFISASFANKRMLLSVTTFVVVMAIIPIGLEMKGRPTPNDEQINFAYVQGGGPRGTRAAATDPGIVFDRQVDASLKLLDQVGNFDFVVWPENVIDVDEPIAKSNESEIVGQLARKLKAPIAAGVVESLPHDRFRNSIVIWNSEGKIVDQNVKRHRVPFGEYIPFRSLIDRVADTSLAQSDATIGKEKPIVLGCDNKPECRKIGVLISYEVFFPEIAQAAAKGTNYLIVPTNSTSYRSSAVALQELSAARMRAIETGRSLIQVAPTGLSAFVLSNGSPEQVSDFSQPVARIRPMPVANHSNGFPYVYRNIGDVGVALLMIVLVLVRRQSPIRRRIQSKLKK